MSWSYCDDESTCVHCFRRMMAVGRKPIGPCPHREEELRIRRQQKERESRPGKRLRDYLPRGSR